MAHPSVSVSIWKLAACGCLCTTLLVLFDGWCVAADDDGYGGGSDYGYAKKSQPIEPTYIYRPMPLPSFTSYGSTYGTGQASGQFVPGTYRPVFHDVYQAIKVGYDTNRSPVVFSHLRYAPRLPPPLYGDLGSFAQRPSISELFTTNSTETPRPKRPDQYEYGEEGSASAYDGDDKHGSEVSQHQYGPYFNNTNNTDEEVEPDDDNNSTLPSSSSASPSSSTSTTTTLRPSSSTTTTAKPATLPDEQPASGFGQELNNDYNYKDVAPKRGHSDDSAPSSAIADFLADNDKYGGVNERSEEVSNENEDEQPQTDAEQNGGRRMYGQSASSSSEQPGTTSTTTESAPSSTDSGEHNRNVIDSLPKDFQPVAASEKVERKRTYVDKYLLQNNQVDDENDDEKAPAYGYKGVDRYKYGRKQRPSPATENNIQEQTDYETDSKNPDKDQQNDRRYQQLDVLPDLIGISNGENEPKYDTSSSAQREQQQNTVSSVSADKVYEDFDSNGEENLESKPRRRRRQRKRPRNHKTKVIIEVEQENNDNNKLSKRRPELNARTLIPTATSGDDIYVMHAPRPTNSNARRRRPSLISPQQQQELKMQQQLQQEFNVPQQVVQPFKTAAPSSPTGQTNLEQRFSVPRMLVSDKPVAPSPESMAAGSISSQRQQQSDDRPTEATSSLEQDFEVPRGDVTVSEQPPELAPPTTSLRGGQRRQARPAVWAL